MVTKRFKRWIKKRGDRKRDPLDVLLKLYAKEDGVVEELEEVRLNPDFTSVFRNDLEFYIPQLCSYCLYGEGSEEIKRFIVIASQSNLYFSHRVLFFIESLDTDDDLVNDNVQNILFSLSQIQLTDSPLGLNSHLSKSNSLDEISQVIEKYKKVEILPEATIQAFRNKIMAEDIKLPKYNFTMGVKTNLINENGYLSTPFFVFSLTNLCTHILRSENREEALFEGLQKINMHLPANVYVPFVNSSMRNYVVLHIKVMEAKVFVTKERAPFLICIEVFRPEEHHFKDKIEEEEDEFDSEAEEDMFDIEQNERSKNQSELLLLTFSC